MNSVFKKASMPNVLLPKIHCFFSHFFLNFLIPTLSLLFCERALESLFICSLVPVQPRLAYLDKTEKIVDWNIKYQYKQNSLIYNRFLF